MSGLVAVLRRCLGRLPVFEVREAVDLSALRRRMLGGLVFGKTFVEVGGLWGTVNETVSVAIRAGAREATMIDQHPRESEWWTRFDERCAKFGVVDVEP